jgi:hypothetical protein
MNNSVFGKLGENVWGRTKTSYVASAKRFKTKIESSNVLGVQKITSTFACVFSMPEKVDLCKPIHVMTAIFDLSKMHMYSAWYDAIRPAFPTAKLHMTDTDSLAYSVQCASVEEYERTIKTLSEGPNPLYDNGLTIGLLKSEINKDKNDEKYITSFVAIKAKCYSYKCCAEGGARDTPHNVLKGTGKKVVNMIPHELYKDVIEKQVTVRAMLHNIRSKQHNLGVIRQERSALTHYDDKGHFISTTETLAHGHYRLRRE